MRFFSPVQVGTTIVLFAAAAVPAMSQSIFDSSLRTAPQFLQYRLNAPVGETISEFTTPVFVLIPVSSTLSFDVATAYANARVQPNGNSVEQSSSISGFTDTQIRANVKLGTDFVVITAGLNIPTGKETASEAEQLAAFRIGNDFLFSGEWWITIFPGLALVLLVLSVNLLGDWLRDALNPRLR